jgi:hypothetical protein
MPKITKAKEKESKQNWPTKTKASSTKSIDNF